MTGGMFKFIKVASLYAGFYLFSVTLFSRSLADNDLWGYLSFGSLFWEDGYFPFHDVFSYTPTKPVWVYHEWLTGVFFYLIYRSAGPAGLQLLQYIIILLTICLMYLPALKKGGGPISSSMALIPAMLLISFGYVPVRAQIFTYLFFILTLYILESAKKIQKWSVLWWVLPIQILWCNLHGGFVAGLGVLFLYALGEAFSGRKSLPYIGIGIAATLTTLINPYGIQYWAYTLHAISMPRPEIDEWMSILTALKNHVQDVPVFIFLILTLICSVSLIFRRKRNLTDLLVIGVTIFLGCKSIRHIVLFGLVFGSYLPVVLSEYWQTRGAKRIFSTLPSWVSQSMPVALLLLLYVFINPSLSLKAVPSFALWTPSPHFPVGAIRWIKENRVQGNILPHFDWGEFLIWRCYPACRVAMDGRYETVYEEQVYKEYSDFLNGREKWHVFLQKYPHDMVLIKPNTRAHLLMLREPSWRVVYADQGCVLFLKK